MFAKTKNMSRSAKDRMEKPGKIVRQKAGRNRELLSAGLGVAHARIDSGRSATRLPVSYTRQLKPTRRCATCWAIVPNRAGL
jgi:putative transposase